MNQHVILDTTQKPNNPNLYSLAYSQKEAEIHQMRSIIGSIIGLSLLVTTVVVQSVGASNDCVDIECLKQKLERICKEGAAPSYLDCENILRCIDAGEQEIMRECARGYYLVQN